MKLLAREQKDLNLALKEAGVDEYFHFVKKKGWLVITHPISSGVFSFHRKKSTTIKDGKFVDSVAYRLIVNEQMQEYDDWAGVIEAFRIWLNLPKSTAN